MEVSNQLSLQNINARVVSLLSWELFSEQDSQYQKDVLGSCKLNVSIEAQSSFGWERFTGIDGLNISVNSFGKSGKYSDIQEHFGFTVDQVVKKIVAKMSLVETSK